MTLEGQKKLGRTRASTRVVIHIDVVGFSSLTADDDPDTMHGIKQELDALAKFIAACGGNIHTRAGDAFLASFGSINDALQFAFAVQERRDERTQFLELPYRLGIHVGEVYDFAGEVTGTAINTAARLEKLAPTGGVCMSASAWEMSPASFRTRFVNGGAQQLRNIPEPVNCYVFNPEKVGDFAEKPSSFVPRKTNFSTPFGGTAK